MSKYNSLQRLQQNELVAIVNNNMPKEPLEIFLVANTFFVYTNMWSNMYFFNQTLPIFSFKILTFFLSVPIM